MTQEKFNPHEEVDLEVIIGTRNESHDLTSTIHSLIFALEASPYSWRILIIDNGSTDYSSRYFIENRFGEPALRGLVARGYVYVYYYPWIGNVSARDWAVRNVATAKYLVFADAHIQVEPDSITNLIDTLEKYSVSHVHSTMDYWGSPNIRQGVQYSIKFGEKGIYGTWTNMRVFDNTQPFYIGALGHAYFAIKRDEYFKIGGYNPYLREDGGGELSFCIASWMLGEGCMVDMKTHMYHSMFGRGYNYNSLNLIHNYFIATYIISGDRYTIPTLMTYYQNKPEAKALWKKLYDEAMEEARPHREYIVTNQKRTFDDLIGTGKEPDCDGSCRPDKKGSPHIRRAWDIKNDELYGKHLSFTREFELKEVDGKVFIGDLEINDPDALALYNNLKASN